MPNVELITAKCPECGKGIGVRPDQIGRRLHCPSCKLNFDFDKTVPRPARGNGPAPPPSPPPYDDEPRRNRGGDTEATHHPRYEYTRYDEPRRTRGADTESTSLWRDPVRLAAAMATFASLWLLIFFILIAIWTSRGVAHPILIAFVVVSFLAALVTAYFAFQLIMAKNRAIAGHPVWLFFGLARLVTWEQNDGLLFLRNKGIDKQVYGPETGGGLRIIYSVLGEELRGRVPLALQLTWFRDERVLTREAIQLTVKVAIWWQVADLEKYFYTIEHREVHAIRDRDRGSPGERVVARAIPTSRGLLTMAEIWVRTLAESCLRTLISDTGTFLIVSKRAASCLHLDGDPSHLHAGADDITPATPDVMARQLEAQLGPLVEQYGLKIDRVEIQEVQLPHGLQEAVDDVWVASTQPTKSVYEAEALRNRLQVLCKELGQDAAGMLEIVRALPEGTLLGNPLAGLQSLLAPLGALGGQGSAPPPSPPPAFPLPAPPAVPRPRAPRPPTSVSEDDDE